MRRLFVASLFFVALLAAWQGMVWSGRWSPVLLPSPQAVGEYLTPTMDKG
jgi:NitT/TauT family transport system permease protein